MRTHDYIRALRRDRDEYDAARREYHGEALHSVMGFGEFLDAVDGRITVELGRGQPRAQFDRAHRMLHGRANVSGNNGKHIFVKSAKYLEQHYHGHYVPPRAPAPPPRGQGAGDYHPE